MVFGRILGTLIGYAVAGWPTAIIGFLVGLYFDRGFKKAQLGVDPAKRAAIEQAFFRAVFPLMGRLSKIDGHISAQEISSTEDLIKRMGLSEVARQEAIRLFKEGADENFDVVGAIESFIAVCGAYANLRQVFLVYLITIAYADENLHAEEESLLRFIADKLGYSGFAFSHLLGMVKAQNHFHRNQNQQGNYSNSNYTDRKSELAFAYQALGVAESASDAEIKKAYRKLMSEFHPDKLTGRGMPDELIKEATERSQEIQAAYDLVKKSRQS